MSEVEDPLLIEDLFRLCGSTKHLRSWLFSKGLLHNLALYKCGKCAESCSIELRSYKLHDGVIWYCNNCNKGTCLRKQSFFARSGYTLESTLELIYYWCYTLPTPFIRAQCRISPEAIDNWFYLCREICINHVRRVSTKIGGPDKNVEIAEHTCCKGISDKKSSRVLILGGVERENNKNLFLVPVSKRCSTILLDLLTTHIEKGSLIVANANLTDLFSYTDYKYLADNYRITFKSPVLAADTNTIKNVWACLKVIPASLLKEQLPYHLAEFIVRRKILKLSKNRLIDFLEIIAGQYTDSGYILSQDVNDSDQSRPLSESANISYDASVSCEGPVAKIPNLRQTDQEN